MDVTLRQLTDQDEFLALAAELDVYAGEVAAEFRDDAMPAGVTERLARKHFGAPEWVALVAYSEAGAAKAPERIGICVTAPLEDPLSLERIPLIVLLHVHPSYRHRGLARKLVTAVQEELRGRGIKKLAARAGHNDDALISMGERWGFLRHWELMLHE